MDPINPANPNPIHFLYFFCLISILAERVKLFRLIADFEFFYDPTPKKQFLLIFFVLANICALG